MANSFSLSQVANNQVGPKNGSDATQGTDVAAKVAGVRARQEKARNRQSAISRRLAMIQKKKATAK